MNYEDRMSNDQLSISYVHRCTTSNLRSTAKDEKDEKYEKEYIMCFQLTWKFEIENFAFDISIGNIQFLQPDNCLY